MMIVPSDWLITIHYMAVNSFFYNLSNFMVETDARWYADKSVN